MDFPRLRDYWLLQRRLPGAVLWLKVPWLNIHGVSGRSYRQQIVACVLVTVCAGLALSSASAAVLLGVAAGIAVQCHFRRWNLRQVKISSLPGKLASFQFDGSRTKCFFDETAVARLAGSWRARLVAAMAAGGVCFAAQRVPQLHVNLPTASSPSALLSGHLIVACRRASPFFVASIFLLIDRPAGRWATEIKAAVRKRAAASMERMLSHREIAALTAGTGALYQALGVEQRSEYQAAVYHYLRVHTSEVVLRPEAALAVLETLLELARQDLQRLGRALALYRNAELQVGRVTTLAVALRNPVYQARAEALSADLNDLPRYAAQRRWEDLERQAASLEGETSNLANDLRARSLQGSPVVLAPGSDPYRLLGVDANTPTPILRKLRLRLAQLYHPDAGDGTSNSAKMAELNAAYDAVMIDRAKR